MRKIEIINKSIGKLCNKCSGDGCKNCEDGLYWDKNYIIIAEDNNGKKIAFQSEFMGK